MRISDWSSDVCSSELHASCNMRMAPVQVTHRVGVEHVQLHAFHSAKGSRASASWLRSWLLRKSVGTFAALSALKKLSHVAGLRDKITSPVSGSWRMKTSLVSNRKAAGKRTA